ncbi:MAG: arginyltransferase [Thiohalobacteraceae bacterium]
MNAPRQLQFFTTPPHPCPYLPGEESVSLFAEPSMLNLDLYSRLARLGFRRSGSHVYRPACSSCNACVPVRVPVSDFQLRRRDRRCLARNADLTLRRAPARFDEEHFRLYDDYLGARHPGAGMDQPTPAGFRQFLIGAWSDTWFMELRLAGRLVAAGVVDQLDDGLSAVYSYFDPALPDRGLGNYVILQQIELTRAMNLPYLYLGYWIEASDKMAYKGRFRPLEALHDGSWLRLP